MAAWGRHLPVAGASGKRTSVFRCARSSVNAPGSAVSFRALTPAVLEPVEKARLARLAGSAARGTAHRVEIRGAALATGLHRESGRAQHDDETGDAERRVAAHRAEDDEGQTDKDHERGEQE